MSGTYHRNTEKLSRSQLEAVIQDLENKLRYKQDTHRKEVNLLYDDIEYWRDLYFAQKRITDRHRRQLSKYRAA